MSIVAATAVLALPAGCATPMAAGSGWTAGREARGGTPSPALDLRDEVVRGWMGSRR